MRLKELREENGLTSAEIANAIGVTEETIIGIEDGTIEPTIAQVVKLANLFRCSADYLQSSPQPNPPKSPEKDKRHIKENVKFGLGCFTYTFVFLIIGIALLFFISSIVEANGSCNGPIKTAQQTLSRAAKNSDVSIDSELENLTGINLVIRPSCDIDNLEITIRYYDDNGKLLEYQVKTIGNVKDGEEYRVQISLLDFSWDILWNIDHETISVTGGTVTYLQ